MEFQRAINKTLILMIFILMTNASCKNKVGKVIIPEYANHKVNFHIVDSTVYIGNKDSIFSQLLPVKIDNEERQVHYDWMTKKIFEFKKSGATEFYIKKIYNIKNNFEKYPGFVSKMGGVVAIDSTMYLLISEPYSLLVDKNFKLIQKITSNVNSQSRLYHRAGNINHIIYDSKRKSIFFPVFPDLPPTHEDYFKEGRIAELNWKRNTTHLLPLGLPPDYLQGIDYQLFSIPLMTTIDNILIYIYPGSNYLFAFNLQTNELSSVLIKPQHVNDIFTKEIGNQPGDAFFSLFECNNFYRIMNVNENILLFYWEGKNRDSISERIGFNHLNCYVLSYSFKSNKILFDIPVDISGVNNNPVFAKNEMLYFQKKYDLENKNIKTTFLHLKLE